MHTAGSVMKLQLLVAKWGSIEKEQGCFAHSLNH